jgi:hypothetical protein
MLALCRLGGQRETREVLRFMAICWKCPRCSEISCEEDVNAQGQPLSCDSCERVFLPSETECPVCHSPNPWARRDSVHYWCRTCGHTQMFHSHRATA